MKTTLKMKLLAPMTALGLMVLTITACQKDTPAPGDEGRAIEAGSPKIPTYIFGYNNATAPYVFQVQRGTDPTYGQARNNTFQLIGMVSQTGAGFTTSGYNGNCGVITDPNYCYFDKGSSPTTYGNTFYIIPSQFTGSPRKILRVKFNSNNIPLPPVGTAWFVYNKTTNTWTAQTGATNFASYAVVTSTPVIGC